MLAQPADPVHSFTAVFLIVGQDRLSVVDAVACDL